MFKRVDLENKEILDSWKEISTYLGRDIRTCFRWEKELGLPINRIDSASSRSKVFAYRSEIDQWLKEKTNSKEIHKKPLLENRRLIIGLLSSFALLSIIFVFLYFAQIWPFGPSNEIPSIAVLPFKNLNPSENEEYICAGITDAIIDHLAILNDLKVISPLTTSKYKNIDKSAEEIGKELGVSHVLNGNVENTEQKFKFSVQLVSVKDNTHIWNKEYEEKLENILYVKDNIISEISGILSLSSAENPPVPLDSRRPSNYQALDSFLKGNYIQNILNRDNNDKINLYHQGKYYLCKCDKDSNELAIRFFREALKLDNNFAEAHLGLAHCYANFVNFRWDPDKSWLDMAEESVKTAQAISPDLPENYSTLIQIYLLKEMSFDENTKDLAFELAQEGIRKFPYHAQLNSIVGYSYYIKYGAEGDESDFEKALKYKQQSHWLNPNSINNITFTEFLMLNREHYRALDICNTINKKTLSSSSISMIDFRLAEIYYYMGDLESSETIFKQFEIPLSYKTASKFFLGMIASQRGEKEKAQNIIADIFLMYPEKNRYRNDHLKLASIYFGLGMKEAGFKFLKSFFNEDIAKKIPYIFIKFIDMDKNFDMFKGDKEFKKIIKGGDEWQEAKPSE